MFFRAQVFNHMAVRSTSKDGDFVVGRRRFGLPEVDEIALDIVLGGVGGGGSGDCPLDAERGGAQGQDVLQLRNHRRT